MRMMCKEMHKFFVRQKAFFWIFIFIGIKIFSMWYSLDTDKTESMMSYDTYLEKLGGRLNEEKAEYITGCYNRLNEAAKDINDLEDCYEQGYITKEIYLQQLNGISEIKKEQETIRLFYNKYQYALENPKERYIVDEHGWEELLTKERIDYLLVVLLFLITVPVFCMEYETEMNYLHLCSKNGRTKLTVIKIILLLVVSGILSFIFNLIEFLLYKHAYGMNFGYAPIQSLSFFKESHYTLTFLQVWKLIMVSRILGTVFLSLMIMAVSVIVRKNLLSIIVNALLVIIPVILSDNAKLKYLLPLPTGLLYGTGYFFPDIYDYQFVEQKVEMGVEKYVSFSSFTRHRLYLLLILFVTVMCVLMGVIVWKYTGLKLLNIKRKNVAVFLVFCMTTVGMYGCSDVDDRISEEFYKNSYSTSASITQQYYFYVDGSKIIGQDMETGESFSVIRDVFEQQSSDSGYMISIFTTDKYLYYAKDGENRIQIFRVDLTDFSEKCLYNKSYDFSAGERFWDLIFVSKENFFVHDSVSGCYFYISRRSGKWSSLGNVGFLTLGEYGDKVYFVNSNSQLVEYQINTGEEAVYSEINLRSPYSVKSSSYYIFDGYCYYTNMLEHDYIYRYCFETGTNELFLQRNDIQKFFINAEYFYYLADKKLYQIDLSSLQEKEILNDVDGDVRMGADGVTLYVEKIDDEGKIQWVKMEVFGEECISCGFYHSYN